MILTCQRCGAERHSRSRYCEDCASDLLHQRMIQAYRIAAIVPRETSQADAAEIACGLANIREAS